MTLDEAREEIGSIDYFCKCACNACTANDWYCPTECGTLRKARQIDFDRIVKSYAKNDGDLSKVFRYINQAKVTTKRTVRMNKPILDVCCGSKMFWFDKNNPNVEFCDNRTVERHEFYPNRYIEVNPDTVCDFTALPFDDCSYKLVVFDPPHLIQAGEKSWLALKYGRLTGNWKEMLKKGFAECFRVLENEGILIFKWSEVDIPLKEILKLTPQKPLFGHRSGKNMNTHWVCFMKGR